MGSCLHTLHNICDVKKTDYPISADRFPQLLSIAPSVLIAVMNTPGMPRAA